jgi:hypothetical protein
VANRDAPAEDSAGEEAGNSMGAETESELDERAALELMGWVRGGPDREFWVVRDPPAGLGSLARMSVARWRPTRDAACLELLMRAVRSRGVELEVAEGEAMGDGRYTCVIADPAGGSTPVRSAAATRGLAVVRAALAHAAGSR